MPVDFHLSSTDHSIGDVAESATNAKPESFEHMLETGEAQASRGEPSIVDAPAGVKPRTRPLHDLSDGESDSEDPGIGYRALRSGQFAVNKVDGRAEPVPEGIRPKAMQDGPVDFSTADIQLHVGSGSRPRVETPFNSFTRSAKTAAAWSVGSGGSHVVAKVRLTPENRMDLTVKENRERLTGAMARNMAQGSQEVLTGTIPHSDILAIYKADKLSVKTYNELKTEPAEPGTKFVRSRAQIKDRPAPVRLTQHYPLPELTIPDPASSVTKHGRTESPTSDPAIGSDKKPKDR